MHLSLHLPMQLPATLIFTSFFHHYCITVVFKHETIHINILLDRYSLGGAVGGAAAADKEELTRRETRSRASTKSLILVSSYRLLFVTKMSVNGLEYMQYL